MKKLLFLPILFFSHLLFAQSVEISVQTGHTAAIKKVLFSPDNKWIVSLDIDNTVVVWDLAQGKQYNSIQNKTEQSTDMVFVNDSTFAIAFQEKLIRLYNINNCSLVKEFKTETEIGGIAAINNSNTLFFGGTNLFSLNLNSGKIETFNVKSHGIFNVVKINDAGTLLVVGGKEDRFFKVLSINNSLVTVNNQSPQNIKKSFLGYLSSADFNNQDGRIIVSTTDGKIKSFNLDGKGFDGATTDFPTNPFNDVKASAGYIFAAAGKNGISVFSGPKWDKLPSLIDHKGSVNSLALSSNKQLLAAAGSDFTITLWDVNKQQLLKTIKGNVNRINSVAFTQDGNSILIGYTDGSFRASNLISNASKSSHIEPSKVSKSLGWNYAVGNISAQKSDSVLIKFYYLHNSPRQTNEAYDAIKVYDGIWKTENGNELSLVQNKTKQQSIIDYTAKLKSNLNPLPFQIFPDSSYVAVSKKLKISATIFGSSVTVRDLSTDKILCTVNPKHTDRLSALAINDEYSLLVTASWDGLIKFWDLKTGKFLVTYGAFGANDYIYLDKDNNYFASKGSLNYIAFRYNHKVFPFDQFDLKFNRPDIVLDALPFISKDITENFKKAFAKRLSKLKLTEKDLIISTELPVTTLTLPDKLYTKDGQFSFKCKAVDSYSEISSISVYVNGVPEYGKNGKTIKGRTIEEDIKLELNPGANTIQVMVTNLKGQSSLKETFEVFNDVEKRKPNLYLVLIGVSEYEQTQYNLKYAAKDANDLGDFMKKNKSFETVNTKLILNSEAKNENIKAVNDFFAPAKVDDVVMILVAGHGVLDKNLDYYLASTNMDFTDPAGKGISYESIDRLLENNKCRNRIMFLDACHSGEVDKEQVKVEENKTPNSGDLVFRAGGTGLSNIEKINSFELAKSVFADFRANNGAWVISSAGATEYAIEGGNYKNGVFTYAMLNGLTTGAADLNKDKKIMMSELQKYLTEEVNKLTKGQQKPNVRNENLFNDIRIK